MLLKTCEYLYNKCELNIIKYWLAFFYVILRGNRENDSELEKNLVAMNNNFLLKSKMRQERLSMTKNKYKS